jgi:hypothetical protein
MSASSHSGVPFRMPQPNGWDTSTPSTTASLPCSITARACAGSVTIRNQPCPGPPCCASMKSCSSWIRCDCRRIDAMSSHGLVLIG